MNFHGIDRGDSLLDGNGCLGRLLTTLLLCHAKVLRYPVLYLSLYLKANRQRYYELLQAVREHGVWEEWLEFFLAGVRETAGQAVDSALRIQKLLEDDRRKVEATGRGAANTLRLHTFLGQRPITSVRFAAKELSLSVPTVTDAIERLLELDILKEITGRARGRLFRYHRYVAILDEGTEPLPRSATA